MVLIGADSKNRLTLRMQIKMKSTKEHRKTRNNVLMVHFPLLFLSPIGSIYNLLSPFCSLTFSEV